MRLEGKVAIVTGASRGIGAAIARRLAAEGARVAVNYAASEARAAEVVEAIRGAGSEAVALRADMGDPAEVAGLFRETAAVLGRPGILVNNAGVFEGGTVDTLDARAFARHFDVNVRGPLLATAEAARVMAPGGRIIHISSGLGSTPAPGASLYGATKAALHSLAASHAVELGPKGITVNCVAPGTTETDMLRGGLSEEAIQGLIAATPLGRLGRPEDIAAVVAFLASEDGGWITGQVIAASGGLR